MDFPSEGIPQAHLNLPRGSGAGDLSEGRGCKCGVWIGHAHRVRDVEQFGPRFEALLLVYGKLLGDGDIPVVASVAIDDERSGIAVAVERGHLERSDIEPTIRRARPGVGVANGIGTFVGAAHVGLIHTQQHIDGRAGL